MINRFKIFIVVAIAILVNLSGFAQKKDLSMEEAVIGMWRQYYPQYLRNSQWRGNTDYFTYIDGEEIIQEKAKSSKKSTIYTLDKLNTLFSSNNLDSLKNIPSFKWLDNNTIAFYTQNAWISINVKSNKLVNSIEYPAEAKN